MNDMYTNSHSSPAPARSRRLPLLLGVFIGLLAGWLLVGKIQGFSDGGKSAQPRSVTPRGDLAGDEKATIDLFEQVSPSVVYITSIAHQRDFFSFKVFEVPAGTGSGFIWDNAGHIVTNFHVIKEATVARVTLADHSTWDAKLAGYDASKDIAVLRISAPASRLTPITVGTSGDLRVGQKVFAIGTPFGFDQTLTTGIVSALGRTIPSFKDRNIEGVIQTDAAINPGNSGGPLLDSSGRLIGVNTQIASPSGASAGIGFAVPVDIVNRVVPQLIQHGRVVRPYMGISPLHDRYARQLGQRGVIIAEVSKGGAAEAAGLRGTVISRQGEITWGDVIQKVDDRSITTFGDLLTALEEHNAGDTVTVTFTRHGRTQTTNVTLQAGS